MSSKAALTVSYEDGENRDTFLYSGETIVAPRKDYKPTTWNISGTPIHFHATTKLKPLAEDLGRKERFQTLTLMSIYSLKSIDELRFEDYTNEEERKEAQSSSLNRPTSTGYRPSSPSYSPTSPTYRPCSPTLSLSSSKFDTWSSPGMESSSKPTKAIPFYGASTSGTAFKKAQTKSNRQQKTSSCFSSYASQNSSIESGNWITAGIEVRVKECFRNKYSTLSGEKGVVRTVSGNMCEVYLYDQKYEATIDVCDLTPEEPRKKDKVTVIHGDDFSRTGTLINIDPPDGIVKMDRTEQLKILPLCYIAKQGSSPVRPIRVPSTKKKYPTSFSINFPQIIPEQMSSDSSSEISASLPSTSTFDFSFKPIINFTTETDPAKVFSPLKPQAADQKLLSTLSGLEGQQIRKELLESIAKCMQIQNSLYRLVLLKLPVHPQVKAVADKASPQFGSSDLGLHEASNMGMAGINVMDSPNPPTIKSQDVVGGVDMSLNDGPKTHMDVHAEVVDVMVKAPKKGSMDNISVNFSLGNPMVSLQDVSKAPSLEDLDGTQVSFNTEETEQNPDTLGTFSLDYPGNTLNDIAEASMENQESPKDAPETLLSELAHPLQALDRCNRIQRELFKKLIAITNSDGIVLPDLYTDGQVNLLAVQSKLEEITFKTKMDCSYVQNPFSDHQLRLSSSEDVVQNITTNKSSFHEGTDVGDHNLRELPHGRGKLETVTGELVYTGEWCKGKRQGKGECLILTLTSDNNAAVEHGFYIGGWKNNMRHGSGKMMFSSGAVYEGQWQFDKMTGYGTMKLTDGTIQRGTWKEGSLQGCTVFTWPDGVSEYREYDGSGKAQSSRRSTGKEVSENMIQNSLIRQQLLDLRECVAELKGEKLCLTEQLNAHKLKYDELVSQVHSTVFEIRERYKEQREQDNQNRQEQLTIALEEISAIQKELEEAKGALLCQICFERRRDCIIFPCSHLLYCRQCVTEHKKTGDSRNCPACRGPINSDLQCNINHPS